ncbi:MAG: UPF0182 family protein [Firmicutes bacterium]|nr:UPF0182 family protein [Bacillota bacterium]
MHRLGRWILAWVVAILALLAIAFVAGAGLYTDWLWYRAQGAQDVFWTMLLTQWELRLAMWVLFFGFLWINLLLSRGEVGRALTALPPEGAFAQWLTARRLTVLMGVGALVIAFLASGTTSVYWEVVQRFFASQTVGVRDPVFHLDVGYYMFRYPFYRYLYQMGMTILVVTAIVVALVYIGSGALRWGPGRQWLRSPAQFHLAFLVALIFLWRAWGYRLDMYGLLFSPRGVVFGPGYTDIHANLPALQVLQVIAVGTGVLVLVAVALRRARLTLVGVGLLIAASLVLGQIYPGLVQRFSVEPNELAREAPYISQHIRYTLLGYGLDKVQEKTFPAREDLTYDEIISEKDTIGNVRLWDWKPLLATYAQLQEMRLYYDFTDVDVDRYEVGGQLRQVTLSARELNVDHLTNTAKTWVNLALKYTHGYGAVVSPVNEVTGEGMPRFFVRDIPPVSTVPALAIRQPRIYFGELTNTPVFVRARTPEFDYPVGEDNAYNTYDGSGGIPMDSLFKRLAFALRFRQIQVLLASDISDRTRVLMYRNIHERVRKIAPFLRYDRDPYLVIAGGRLYWIQDAYVTSSLFPYSMPVPGWGNYVRNSIKVVIDAYNGTTTYYIVDPKEPLARAWAQIFPRLFKPLEAMPPALRAHLRYPEDLFAIQSHIYATYHMKDPTVFYNKEDVWSIPTEIFGTEQVAMEPYYIVMRLPGEPKPEFVLLLPFTPTRKNNMVAWMAARSDGANYGKLLVYTFPKDRLSYGPMQIEARINQDPYISQRLSLWDQKGSRVIRGNLLVIPVRDSLLYVEPLFLQADQSQMPELKQVIVAYGGNVVMADTLAQALRQAFGLPAAGAAVTGVTGGVGQAGAQAAGAATVPVPAPADNWVQLSQQADQVFRRAQDRLRAGDWSGYGQAQSELGALLKRLAELASKSGAGSQR